MSNGKLCTTRRLDHLLSKRNEIRCCERDRCPARFHLRGVWHDPARSTSRHTGRGSVLRWSGKPVWTPHSLGLLVQAAVWRTLSFLWYDTKCNTDFKWALF